MSATVYVASCTASNTRQTAKLAKAIPGDVTAVLRAGHLAYN